MIETENLRKNYGDVVALNSLNLKVPKNSIFAFLGPNGAGKTTTIKLLLGLTHLTSGGAEVLGYNIVTRISCSTTKILQGADSKGNYEVCSSSLLQRSRRFDG